MRPVSVCLLVTTTAFCTCPTIRWTPKTPTATWTRKRGCTNKARLHKLGTDPANDPKLLSRAKNPEMGIRPDQYPAVYLSDDDTQLYGDVGSVDRRANVWIANPADLTKPSIAWKRLASPTDSVYAYLKLGNRLFLQSIKGAPNGQILVTDATNPGVATATVLLPESKQHITRMGSSKDFLFVTLSDGINETIRQYDARSNQWATVPIPGTATMYIEPYDAPRSNDVLAYVMSWNNPGTNLW
ncbi:hypothetical protein [Fibrella aquatilis]|uniref:hypothetical protein n=1 Tax=Fibrella aquatilis TaxID=2817059 RepID=UPI001E600E0C|nr:hypothetical protein [Fibrella aquatilis]